MSLADSLADEIDNARNSFRSDRYEMSINELSLMYRNGELLCNRVPWNQEKTGSALQPARIWNDMRKSLLIESILLRIPIPQIVIHQNSEGTWTVLDGIQRLLTVFAFMGVKPVNSPSQHLALQSTKMLPSLAGACWTDLSDNERLLFKRYKINVLIVLSTIHQSEDLLSCLDRHKQFYCRF